MIRLSKFLSNAGIDARRKVEEYIADGRVKVNDQLIDTQGFKIDPEKDVVKFDDKIIHAQKDFTYIILNKPSGYLCTSEDTHGRKSVLELVRDVPEFENKRLFIVGRLDKETEGLLIITDDGDFSHKMMHPSFEKNKKYLVYAKGDISDETLKKLEEGVEIDIENEKYKTKPCSIELISREKKKTKFYMTIHEGKKRQIRLMIKAVGSMVMYLKRISIGDIELGDLEIGKWKQISPLVG